MTLDSSSLKTHTSKIFVQMRCTMKTQKKSNNSVLKLCKFRHLTWWSMTYALPQQKPPTDASEFSSEPAIRSTSSICCINESTEISISVHFHHRHHQNAEHSAVVLHHCYCLPQPRLSDSSKANILADLLLCSYSRHSQTLSLVRQQVQKI